MGFHIWIYRKLMMGRGFWKHYGETMHYIIRAVMTTLTMFIFFVSKNDMNEDRQRTTNRRVPENEQKQNSVNYYVSFVVTKISKKIYALLESCIQVIEIVMHPMSSYSQSHGRKWR